MALTRFICLFIVFFTAARKAGDMIINGNINKNTESIFLSLELQMGKDMSSIASH